MHAGRILKGFAADLANVRQILVDPVSHSSPNKQGAHDFTKIDAAIIHANDCNMEIRSFLELPDQLN